MQKLLQVLILIGSLGVGGCGYFYPGFEGPLGLHSYIHDIPVSRVTTELQCELKDFLAEPQNAGILDPGQAATVSIKFETDQSGTFQYLGIDLTKIGLAGVATLISASNKSPSLQAKLAGKTAATSQIDLSIPQTIKNVKVKAKYVIDPDTGRIKLVPASTIRGLNVVDCDDPTRRLLTSLSLTSFLDRLFQNLRYNEFNTQVVCMSKITLNTQFIIAFDVSAGVNPLIGTAFILPVSGESFDYNPSAAQSLNIVLALKKYNDHDLCTKVPQPQPNRTI
jgi:hypothetical protein